MSEFKSRKSNKIKIINKDYSHNDSKSYFNENPTTNPFNLTLFRDKVIEELELKLKEEEKFESKINEQSNDYNRLYKQFIDNQYNDRLISVINCLINETKDSIDDIRNNFPLHKILCGIVKKFMLSENELIYFSIYLDKLGWINNEYDSLALKYLQTM